MTKITPGIRLLRAVMISGDVAGFRGIEFALELLLSATLTR